MKELKVKNLNISTGGPVIILLCQEDAYEHGFNPGDRVQIKSKKGIFTAIVDIQTRLNSSNNIIEKGEAGIFTELKNKLSLKEKSKIKVNISTKPHSVYYINEKLHGKRLSFEKINTIIKDVVEKRLTDVEITYFVSSCFIHELNVDETVNFIKAMVKNGKTMKFNSEIIADKHCIGGVAGNRTTNLVVPIIAAAGIKIPKTSSRSITSPAGTADTMEVLSKVDLSIEKIKEVVDKTNGCICWGGSMDVAPSDDLLIKIEHPMSLDPVGQMLASVLAKKKASGSTHCLIDIPYGKGAKIKNKQKAKMLKHRFEVVGKRIDMNVKAVITDGSNPVGKGIGPALEARDILYTLMNSREGSEDLKEKSIILSGELLELCGIKEGEKKAREIFENGEAYKKMKEIIKVQGKKIIDPEKINIGPLKKSIKSNKKGIVRHIDNKTMSKIARMSGCPSIKSAGIFLHKKKSDKVAEGDVLYTIYSKNKEKLNDAYKEARENSGFEII
ncbi:MAG: AMP phosphorylase [Nanobdellota archaeon]